MRLCEAATSPYRMKDIRDQIPLTLEGLPLDKTGYHQNCYKSFSGKLDCLQVSTASLSGESSSSSIKDSLRHLKSLSSQSEEARCSFLFPNQCIFCDKALTKFKGKTEVLTTFQSWKHKEPAWKVIEPRAQELKKEALYRKVQGKDLFAMEAKYHPYCRNNFNSEYQNHERGRAEKAADNIDSLQARNIAAHDKSYCVVNDYILRNVIERKEVVLLRSLRNLYMKTLESEGFPNPEYRSEKLARRLQGDKDISRELTFSKVPHRGCIELSLIYSSSITVDEAVGCAYKLGTADQLQEAALTLHSHIIKAFKESKELPWPPTAQELDAVKMDELLPEHLVQFLSSVVTGILDGEKCERTQRLVYSITQDVCRAATNSKWKLPKHILLCATLRHLYRSKQLTTILSRLGHSETYDFSMELETAMAKAFDEISTHLTPQIITGEGNTVFHSEWDNLNRITTNVHGSNVVNSAGGIMIQEVKESHVSTKNRTLPLYDRSSKMRSLKITPPETLPELAFKRVGPKFPMQANFTPPAENQESYDASMLQYNAHLLCRWLSSQGKQQVPGFGGFISSQGKCLLGNLQLTFTPPSTSPLQTTQWCMSYSRGPRQQRRRLDSHTLSTRLTWEWS
uniref:uncharacterized protein n=1 Tax=Myxine glutinosa TaxID=7769 RepID=UPI00358F5BAA